MIQDTFHHKRAKKRMNADVSVSNERIKTEGRMVRLLGEDELDVLRDVMGSAFAIGITKAVPTVKEITQSEGRVSDAVYLKDRDVARVATCSVEDLDFDPEKDTAPCSMLSIDGVNFPTELELVRGKKKQPRLLPHPGTDMEYLQSETGLTDLHFNAKFKKPLGKSSMVRRLQSWLVPAPDERATVPITTGDELVKDGVAHTVSTVDTDEGTVECVRIGSGGNGASMSLTVEDATNLALVEAHLEQ